MARQGIDTAKALTEARELIVSELQAKTAQAVSHVTAANDRISNDVSGLLDRLGQANTVLQSVMTRSAENLTEIEANLTRQTGDVGAYIEKIVQDSRQATQTLAQEASALRDVTAGVLAEIVQLTGSFGEKSVRIEQAARGIDLANRLLETTIEDRSQSLSQLSVQIGERTEQVESLIRSFSGIISDTLANAEARSRDVGASLSASTETAVRDVLGQLSTLRETAQMESARAATDLRQAQEAVIAEMARSVTETTLRFGDATDKMREAARMMQTELEATRSELKRGVFELPKEAEESTAALRKVVTEQLKALSELSSLVGKQNTALDVSRVATARGAETRQAEARVAETRVAEAPRRTVGAEPTEAAPRRSSYTAPAEPAARTERPSRDPAPAPRTEVPASGQRGWVADLLKRASGDEAEQPAGGKAQPKQERAPHHIIESLNSLSVDIARAIDDDAFLELWERYKRGERNVFTRRLYTLPGQQTFEEIRRKYGRDGEFRSAVDRYISDFEQLLADVARTDRDNVMTQSYLTSDTGKVYTLLAHASGRLD